MESGKKPAERPKCFCTGLPADHQYSTSYFNWKYDEIIFASREENLKLIKEAVDVAKKRRSLFLPLGENEHLCREAWAKTHLGDNMTLDLFGEQNELADAMLALGKPVVVYLMNGAPPVDQQAG